MSRWATITTSHLSAIMGNFLIHLATIYVTYVKIALNIISVCIWCPGK